MLVIDGDDNVNSLCLQTKKAMNEILATITVNSTAN